MGMKTIARYATALAAILLMAGAATAQESQVIRPGMTEDEVKAAFGEPQGIRSYGSYTFYFYDNGCEQECGFPDTVFFQDGQVVDAVLRAPWRGYAGDSSSPKGVMPQPTPGGERLEVPADVEGVEVRPARVPTPHPVQEQRDTARADTSSVRS
jgi:hypothetical protein